MCQMQAHIYSPSRQLPKTATAQPWMQKLLLAENQNPYFMFNNFFLFDNCAIYDITWKNVAELSRPQMAI